MVVYEPRPQPEEPSPEGLRFRRRELHPFSTCVGGLDGEEDHGREPAPVATFLPVLVVPDLVRDGVPGAQTRRQHRGAEGEQDGDVREAQAQRLGGAVLHVIHRYGELARSEGQEDGYGGGQGQGPEYVEEQDRDGDLEPRAERYAGDERDQRPRRGNPHEGIGCG